jgi:multidrug efflux pump subunit AcrB
MFGTVLALWVTGTSLNVVSFLGAIIGVGIVAKKRHPDARFSRTFPSRRPGTLRMPWYARAIADCAPVLMTSMAAAFGMLPLAYGYR